ncbi:MAG: TatD family hydrolase [Natronospirillum sp.]
MRLTDTHCHFDFTAFDADREAVLAACAERHVHRIVIPGVTARQWPGLPGLGQALSTGGPQGVSVFHALGLHPYFLAQHEDHHLAQLDKDLRQGKACAVGEFGLHGPAGKMPRQIELLEAQLALARTHGLPVILHQHRAHNEMVRALNRLPPVAGGVVHAFNGSYEMAQEYLRFGLHLGVGGVITYRRAAKTRRAIQRVPLSTLVLETDGPDMPLNGYQGVRNTPTQLPSVLRALSQLRNDLSVEATAQVVEDNASRLFALPVHQ